MRIKNYLNTVTVTTLTLGLLSLSLMEEHSIIFLSVITLATIAAVAITFKKKFKISKLKWNLMAIVLVFLFIGDYIVLDSDFLGSISRFMSVLVILKLFDMDLTKDYWILYALVLFEILTASASSVSIVFMILLIFYIINTIWAMLIFNLKDDIDENFGSTEISVPKNLFSTWFFLSTVMLTFFSIFTAMIIFFIMPRIGVGLFDVKTLDTVKTSGFSDDIDLGTIGPVKLDPTVVMRISFDDNKLPGGHLYIKGLTHDRYSGNGWSRSNETLFTATRKKGLFNTNEYEFIIDNSTDKLLRQHIQLEPLSVNVVFSIGQAQIVHGKFTKLLYTKSGTVHMTTSPYSKKEYIVYSRNVSKNLGLDRLDESPTNLNRFLGTENFDETIEHLALFITEDLGINDDLKKAKTIEKYLIENYKYSLDSPKGHIDDPIADFLYSTQVGYCEHYASSMVALLRYNEIPARIVTGFVDGKWNEYGKFLTIRNRDAHSWVEAYIYNKGWMRFDPTPSAGFNTTSIVISPFEQFTDSLIWRWNRYIIGYSINDQVKTAMNMRTKSIEMKSFVDQLKDKFKGKVSKSTEQNLNENILLYIFGILLVTGLLYLLFKILISKNNVKEKLLPVYYTEMLNILKEKGFTKTNYETSTVFAKRMDILEIYSITEYCEKEKFGNTKPTENELNTIKENIETIKREINKTV